MLTRQPSLCVDRASESIRRINFRVPGRRRFYLRLARQSPGHIVQNDPLNRDDCIFCFPW